MAHTLMTTPIANIKPNPDVIFQELDGETVLLHLKSEVYYTLDETGTRIWQLLSEYGDPEAVIAKMLEEFEVDDATIRCDLANLIGELREQGLVETNEQN